MQQQQNSTGAEQRESREFYDEADFLIYAT